MTQRPDLLAVDHPQQLYRSAHSLIIYAEALRCLTELPAASVDAIVTDPPYSSGGLYRSDRMKHSVDKYLRSDSISGRALATFAGDNRDQRGYLAWCSLWMSEALRVTAPGGVMAVFTDWRQLPITTDAVQAAGWTWRGIVTWHKPINRPQLGRFSAACEFVVWATAGHRPPNYPASAIPGFVSCSASRSQARVHPTEKPEQVLRHLVKIAPVDGIILDPFAGSGTTIVAALKEGRRAVAIEITEHYAKHCAQRIKNVEECSCQS